MQGIVTLALKDLRLLVRDKFGAFWILVFPLMFALFFGTVFSGGGGPDTRPLPIAVIDDDNSQASKSLRERLVKTGSLEMETMPLERAQTAVRRGDKIAYLRIPKGFGESPIFVGPTKHNIELGIDPVRKAEVGFLHGLIAQTYFAGFQDFFGGNPLPQAKNDEKTKPATGLQIPVTMTEVIKSRQGRPRSSFEITFPSAILWGLISCAFGFAIGLVNERTQGTYLRLQTSPLTWSEILAGKGLGCFLACIGVAVLLLMVGVVVFGVGIANPLLLVLGLVFTAFCFTGLMMFIGTLGTTENGVAGAAWGMFMPLAMLGGGFIPLIAMPRWLWNVSHFSPFKWSIFALEGAIFRDLTVGDLLLSYTILFGVGAVFLWIAIQIMRRREV